MHAAKTTQKSLELGAGRAGHENGYLTTNQGVGVHDADSSMP